MLNKYFHKSILFFLNITMFVVVLHGGILAISVEESYLS